MLGALFAGKLRRQFYSDAFHFGEAADAARQVAAGYICLAGAAGWLLGLVNVVVLNPVQIAVIALAALNTVACLFGFLQLRRKRDPRIAIDWLVWAGLLTAIFVAYHNAGVVVPIAFSFPVLAGISTLYQRRQMRPVTIGLGAAAAVVTFLSATSLIGDPTSYSQIGYIIRVFSVLVATTLGLGALAWISMVSRDYLLEQATQANNAIVDSAARARLALEAARVGLWDVPDIEKRQFDVSESFQAVTGYTGEEFNSLFGNLERFVHPEDVRALQEAFATGRTRGTRIRVDFRLLTRSRGYRWFSARARYSENPDGTTRISGSLQDINFIKVAEEALRTGRDQARAANKAKSDFIAVMSHEVRTPLNAILGSVELMRRGVSERESAEMVELIDEAGRGLLAIVNDLLDVSRIDAGKLEIAPAATDVRALVSRTLEFWRPQASAKGIALLMECNVDDHIPVMLDPGRVRQIVGNLISNAIKFTDSGSVKTSVGLHALPDGRVETTISVIDTGPGVPDAVAESIFAAFEQAPGATGRGGAGLGLFISRRLARMMGGDLTLEPARRNGAHFRLTLTADRADAATVDTALSDMPTTDWRGLHVLCVDDNDKNRRIAELLLRQLGFTVTLAASGAEALDVCGLHRFDLILMDIVMPDQDGIQTLTALRSDSASLSRRTPAIALTAKLSPADMEAYREAGFDGVSGKPVDIASLAHEIARALARPVHTITE